MKEKLMGGWEQLDLAHEEFFADMAEIEQQATDSQTKIQLLLVRAILWVGTVYLACHTTKLALEYEKGGE